MVKDFCGEQTLRVEGVKRSRFHFSHRRYNSIKIRFYPNNPNAEEYPMDQTLCLVMSEKRQDVGVHRTGEGCIGTLERSETSRKYYIPLVD